MAPEQVLGKAIDRRADIYAMGVLTFEMLTGRLPFDGETPMELPTAALLVQELGRLPPRRTATGYPAI